VVLLAIGVAIAAYLAGQGQHAKNFSQTFDNSLAPTREMILAVEQERQLSLWQLAGEDQDPRALAAARARFDTSLRGLEQALAFFASMGTSMPNPTAGIDQIRTQLPLLRGAIDAGTLPVADAYTFYSKVLDGVDQGATLMARSGNVPDPMSTLQMMNTAGLLLLVESMSRASALTVAAASPAGLPPTLLSEYRDEVGYYHNAIGHVAAQLDAPLAQRIRDLTASPAWQQVGAMEDAILHPAPTKAGTPPPLPMSIADWRDSANQVYSQLVSLWTDQNTLGQKTAAAGADSEARTSLLAGSVMAAVAVVAFLLSLLLANRLIGRLKRLRTETLALAEVQLPETMRRLSAGEQVDPETDAAKLDFGDDEIGSVAKAFNQAHTAAVAAAVTEARTREGVRAVFLNIAHRSQIVVHRQLEILDDAERNQEDPALLDTFFRLDHLATRERRNAENLIILGGGEPGRKWRRPVPLIELVRSAVAETLDYARVHTGRLPQVYILGAVVADLIHLLAELVDNATSFSPPQSRVDVTGNVVGKGVVVEISDQGMGMAAADLQRTNDTLADPPDFGVATLSADSRLGLFVVAQLGVRHGISVRLAESDYGGIRAIVLVPNSLVTTEPVAVDHLPHYLTGRRVDPPPPTGEIPVAALSQIDPAPIPVATLEPPEPIAPLPPPEPIATLGPPEPRNEYPFPPDTSWRAAPAPAPQDEDRPALPKRRRQANLAPELAKKSVPDEPAAPQPARSAEQARDLMSAIENGTRQGRRAEPDPYPSSRFSAFLVTDEQEGEGDFFSHR
jgi:signal transduction histidine kinase